jgi:hypothetical protein
MKIKDHVRILNDYFVKKIVDEDYNLVSYDENSVRLTIIDEEGIEYPFSMWVGVGEALVSTFVLYDNFLKLEFSPEEKRIIYIRFQNMWTKKREKEERREYEELKKKFES